MRTLILPLISTHPHSRTHVHIDMHQFTHTCTHMRTRTHTHTHTHTHIYTHTQNKPAWEGVLYWVFFRKCGSSKALVRWKAKSCIDRPRARRGGAVGASVLCVCVCVCVGGGAEPVVCLPDAGLPARRGPKGQKGWGGRLRERRGGQRVVAVAPWLHRNPLAPQWRMYSTYTHRNTHACTHNASTRLLLLMRAVREWNNMATSERAREWEREQDKHTKHFSSSYLVLLFKFGKIWNCSIKVQIYFFPQYLTQRNLCVPCFCTPKPFLFYNRR